MLRLRCAARTETGHVRRRNEDRFLCEEDLRLFGVADGVGGLPGGAEAAQAARDSLIESFRGRDAAARPDLARFVARANAAVVHAGRAILPGIATTLTFGCVHEGHFHLGHAGDSRAYLWEDASLQRLTEDHNVETDARRKAARGERVEYSPVEGQAITRCLGNAVEPEAEWATRRLKPGSRYFFCTDGVSGVASDLELAEHLSGRGEPADILHDLAGLVLGRGAPDNATAVLVFIDEI